LFPELLTLALPSRLFLSGLFTSVLFADDLLISGLFAEVLFAAGLDAGLAAVGFAAAGLPADLFAWADNCWSGNNSKKNAITKSFFAVKCVLALFFILTSFKN
jgi:hypothetical protein